MKKKQVLVVEDEQIVANDIKTILHKLGHAVSAIVYSGDDAIKKAKEKRPDLAIVDIVLKGNMDGIELASILRSRFDIPVIYLTAYGDDKTLERAKVTEPFGYILKPFEERNLNKTIEIALYKHQMENALKQSEERYRALYSTMNEGVCLHEIIYSESGKAKDYIIMDVNPAFESITGLKREMAVGRKASELYKTKKPPFLSAFANVAASGKPTSFETYFQETNKHIRLSVFSPERGKFAIVYTDITDRKIMEEALRESEEKFKGIIENVRDVIFRLSPSGVIQYVSPNVKDLYGYAPEDLIGKHLKKTTPASEIPRALEALKGVAAQRRIRNLEINQRDSRGKIIPMEISVAPIKKDKKLIAILGVMRDITKRKHAEDELRENREKLMSFMESAPDSFLLLDKNLKILEINRVALKAIRLKKEEVLGKALSEIVPDLKESGRYDRYMDVIKTGKPLFIDDFIPHPKFGQARTSLRAFKVGDGLGVITSDITERIKIQEQLNRTLNELKQKNVELDDYTYTVSHDLKAPLITIQGFSDILLKKYRGKLEKDAVQYLKRISRSSKRLERLVSDLLRLSRAGRKTGELKKENIKDIVEISLKYLEASIEEKHISVKYPSEFPSVHCDKTRILQVYDNLIVNAVNYIGSQKKPKIEIGWREDEKNYIFWVADNGPGIKEEDTEKIFKVFYKGSAIGSRDGTGIGLSIAKKVIESHMGKIWVESKVGKGSTFYFTIPKL
ncbi:MAG: PAS domain S-box protein [Candidatus Aminicenantes bacterium]|nr:MAG: PAS domain S-box protein [Candidatus Aminicenantes bacterium]